MPQHKNKTKQATNIQNAPLPVRSVPSTFPVALLVDGENVIAPDLMAYILVEAGKIGGVITRHVYGNWAAPSMQVWKKQLAHYGLEQRGNSSGPNATDIALVIGAMDLLYQGIRHFCLVAGDSDYVPLVQRLRQEGCTVVVIGTPAVSSALKKASSIFLSTDQLVPQKSSTKHRASSTPSTSPIQTSSHTRALSKRLTDAYQVAVQQSESKWVLLAALGNTLRKLSPDFEKIYGKKRLSALMAEYPELFETRKREIGKGQVEEVRLRS